MDLTLDSREREMLTTARGLLQKLLDDAARAQIEDRQDETRLRDLVRALGRAGWLCAAGPDAPLFERAAFFVASGEAVAPGLVTTAIAGATLLANPRFEELKSQVERGECLLTFACAAKGAGGSTWTTEADASGGVRVRGTLPLVEYGSAADVLIVVPESLGSGVVLDLRQTDHDRTRRSTFGNDFRADVSIDALVPEAHVLEGADFGQGPVPEVIAFRTAMRLMECAAGARAVTRRTVTYVNTRQQFGKPLAQFQAVKQHAADMLILSEGAYLLALEALASADAEGASSANLWRAAAWVPRAYKDVTLWAHQLHGGMGYARESHLFRWSERAKLRELEIEALLTSDVLLTALSATPHSLARTAG